MPKSFHRLGPLQLLFRLWFPACIEEIQYRTDYAGLLLLLLWLLFLFIIQLVGMLDLDWGIFCLRVECATIVVLQHAALVRFAHFEMVDVADADALGLVGGDLRAFAGLGNRHRHLRLALIFRWHSICVLIV